MDSRLVDFELRLFLHMRIILCYVQVYFSLFAKRSRLHPHSMIAFPSALEFASLLRGVDDITSSNLALVHQVVDLLQLTEAAGLKWCLDETPSEKFDSLG